MATRTMLPVGNIERLGKARRAKLCREIQVGLDQIEAGDVVDAGEAFDEIEDWIKRRGHENSRRANLAR